MYDRVVDGREINFRVSGKLWNRSLVMQDQETGGLWSHLLGQCMQGELKGTKLKMLPSVMTTWKDWRERHPETDVMVWPQPGYRFARDYYQTVGMDRFVGGVVIGGQSRGYPFDGLAEHPLVNDKVGDVPLVVWFDRANGAVYGWRRNVDDRMLEFELPQASDGAKDAAQVVVDRATSSHWDLTRGVAVSGPLEGTQLTPVVVVPSFRTAWEEFHPNSSYWKPSSDPTDQ